MIFHVAKAPKHPLRPVVPIGPGLRERILAGLYTIRGHGDTPVAIDFTGPELQALLAQSVLQGSISAFLGRQTRPLAATLRQARELSDGSFKTKEPFRKRVGAINGVPMYLMSDGWLHYAG